MTGELAGAADIITGAAIARAVEPDAGEGRDGAHGDCLNCGTALIGAHCHACGQNGQVHRTLAAFWHDFTHSILHFEGKIWRTLPMLAFRPGQLTRRYVHGERAKFVSPLALFLFSVFLMFATFSWVGIPIQPEVNTERNGTKINLEQMHEDIAGIKAEIAGLEAQRIEAVSAATPVADIDEKLADLRADLKGLEMGVRLAEGFSSNSFDAKMMTIDSGSKAFDARVKYALDNPKLLLYKMQSNAYKFSWALVLLSVPFVWLIFAWRRQFHLFDHTVFVTYSLCFMTLLFVVMSILTSARLGWISGALLLLAPPVHIFFQLKGAYNVSVFSALWRTLFLMIAAIFVLLSFGLILLGLGAAG